jgi:hypothetical protein
MIFVFDVCVICFSSVSVICLGVISVIHLVNILFYRFETYDIISLIKRLNQTDKSRIGMNMTYWLYNPQTLKEVEMEGKPTFDDLERCEIKGLLIFYDYQGLKMRQHEDRKYFNNSIQKDVSWHDEVAEMDLSELLTLGDNVIDHSSANNKIECFENTVKSNDLIKIKQLNQTDKSNHGGKRVGAGRKPGTSVKHNSETKSKIAVALRGNRNAMKQTKLEVDE